MGRSTTASDVVAIDLLAHAVERGVDTAIALVSTRVPGRRCGQSLGWRGSRTGCRTGGRDAGQGAGRDRHGWRRGWDRGWRVGWRGRCWRSARRLGGQHAGVTWCGTVAVRAVVGGDAATSVVAVDGGDLFAHAALRRVGAAVVLGAAHVPSGRCCWAERGSRRRILGRSLRRRSRGGGHGRRGRRRGRGLCCRDGGRGGGRR